MQQQESNYIMLAIVLAFGVFLVAGLIVVPAIGLQQQAIDPNGAAAQQRQAIDPNGAAAQQQQAQDGPPPTIGCRNSLAFNASQGNCFHGIR
jgi:hypothetical protein